MNMTELRELLREHGGWSMSRKRIKGKFYFYAHKKLTGVHRYIYLCPESQLPRKSEEEIVRKLP